MKNVVKIINEEVQDSYLPFIIKQLSNEYISQNKCTLWDINNGMCDQFTQEIINKIGEESDNLHELTGDMFFNTRDPEFARKNWGEIIETQYGIWSKKMLDYYGYPPVDLQKITDEINHSWIYYNGKHYDAELSNGSKRWYDLPLIKTLFSKF
jgi:hypothetical protein